MIPSLALAASLLLAPRAGAQDDPAPPPTLSEMAPARSAPGWTRQANSLLLYGEDSSLIEEKPLRQADDSGSTAHETLGGVSPDARLAWTLDRKLVWTPGRTKLLESQRQFKLYGTSGQELWRDDLVDLPERGEPVLFSTDGRVLLLCHHGGDGWTAEARSWLGAMLGHIGAYPRLISMALTPNGRFALARWGVPDKSDTHTFMDLSTKVRRDVQSSDLVLGLARIDDQGVVRSGSKVILSFDLAVSSGNAPAIPAVSTGTPPAP